MPKIITTEVTEEFKPWPYGEYTPRYTYIHKEIIKRKYTKNPYRVKLITKSKKKVEAHAGAAWDVDDKRLMASSQWLRDYLKK